MKLLLFSVIIGLAAARPDKLPGSPVLEHEVEHEPVEERYVPKILRSNSVRNNDGSYNFEFETEDGIHRSEFGNPLPEANNAIGQAGRISFPLPNGEIFELDFVADVNGFQPQSNFLPEPPAFPHPLPQFVLDQIERARIEDEEAARREAEEHEIDFPQE